MLARRARFLAFTLAGAAGQLLYTAASAVVAIIYASGRYRLRPVDVTIGLIRQGAWFDWILILLWSLATGALLALGIGTRAPRARALSAALLASMLVVGVAPAVNGAADGAAPGVRLVALLVCSFGAPWFLVRLIRVFCYAGAQHDELEEK